MKDGVPLWGLGTPAGLAGAGLLLQFLPGPAAMLVLASVLSAGVLSCARMPALRHATWPPEDRSAT